MSAYIVDKKHILYLVQAATCRRLNGRHSSTFTWWHGGSRHELRLRDDERAVEVGNMLWRENVKSVSARYPNESSATLPGPRGGSFVVTQSDFMRVLWQDWEPAEIFKACDCYEYQSCEHDGWKTSEAHAFIVALRHTAWHAVSGYEDAPWGAPPTQAEKEAEHRARQRQAA